MPKNAQTIAQLHTHTHASKVMLKILQARLQQYVNGELPDVQAGFRKGRGTRDQIGNIRWNIEKPREFQKNIYFLINMNNFYLVCYFYLCHNIFLSLFFLSLLSLSRKNILMTVVGL